MDRIRVAPKGTKSIYVECAVWYDTNLREIHITAPGSNDKFHVRVSNREGSTAYQPGAYQMWRKLLVQMGRWPEDAE